MEFFIIIFSPLSSPLLYYILLQKMMRQRGEVSLLARPMRRRTDEADATWQTATLFISMTQLSQAYFSRIKQPYGKPVSEPEGRGGAGGECQCKGERVNKWVCSMQMLFGLTPPPAGLPPPGTVLSLWHGNGSKLMKTLHSLPDNFHWRAT